MTYFTFRSSYIYLSLHLVICRSYIWPFEGSHYAYVVLDENEFETPALDDKGKNTLINHVKCKKIQRRLFHGI